MNLYNLFRKPAPKKASYHKNYLKKDWLGEKLTRKETVAMHAALQQRGGMTWRAAYKHAYGVEKKGAETAILRILARHFYQSNCCNE